MGWYPQHPGEVLLFFLWTSFFLLSYIHLKWQKNNWIQSDAIRWEGLSSSKTKAAWNGSAGSEMKRESNFGTGRWFGVQWTVAMFVWTSLCNNQEKPNHKHYLPLWCKVMTLCWWCWVFKQALPLLQARQRRGC